MTSNVNTGVRVLHLPAEEVEKTQFTIVVSGLGRSGTTMISKVLTAGGIRMGVAKADTIHEDVGISNLIETNQADRLRSEVERRNGLWDVWGFKRPLVIRHHELLAEVLRNPRYIIIYRDPLAVTLRNSLSMGFTIAQGLNVYLRQLEELNSFVIESKKPKLLLSYEKVLENPRHTIAAVRKFAGVAASFEDAMVNVVRPNDPDYLAAVAKKH